jgi:hypothetical protein
MAISSGQLAIGTASVQVPVTFPVPWTLEVKNQDTNDNLYIGNGDVSSTTGLRLSKEERITLRLAPGDFVHIVSTKEGHVCSFLAFSQGF